MKKATIVLFALTAIICGCRSMKNGEQKSWKPEYRIQAGYNKGGITENTEFKTLENVKADAVSGATNPGGHVAGRIQFPVGGNSIETGVDVMLNTASLSFDDNINAYSGVRDITTAQFMIPLAYNIGVFKTNHQEGLFQIKLSYMLQFN